MSAALGAAERVALLRLAAEAVRAAVRGAPLPETSALARTGVPAREPRGAFVTLTRDGTLRGCLGRVESFENLARTVIVTAAAAARDDPRFEALREPELPGLRIELSVLDVPRPVTGDAIVPGRDGVILDVGERRALFLPQVATRQGWNRQRLLEELSRKAGLEADAWRRGQLRRFRAECFAELLDVLLAQERGGE